MQTQLFSEGNVDSNNANSGNPIAITSQTNWTRALTVNTNGNNSEMRFQVYVIGGVVSIRLTSVSQSGRQHGLLQTDLTQPNDYVRLATIKAAGSAAGASPAGTVNQPGAGDTLSINIDPVAGEEIGFEFLAISGSPTVEIIGSQQV